MLYNQDLASLAYLAIDAAMSAAWRTLESIDQSIQPLADGRESKDLGLFLSSLSSIRNGQEFTLCVSRLADVNPVAAIEISFASAHLVLCRQFILTELTSKANSEAITYGRFLITAARACGLELSRLQEQGVLNRAASLPAKLKAQQQLRLATKLGRVSKKLCFVIGMHRSGTSALTGMLSKMGLDAPSDLMPETQDNPKGYFESVGIMRENNRLLAKLMTNWTLEKSLPQGWAESEAASSWRLSFLQIIEAIFKKAEHPVIKDPRFCLLIDGLDCWLQDYSVDIKFILLIRDPREVVASLLARPNKCDSITRRSAFKLWIKSMLTAERATRKFDRIIIIANDLFEAPAAVQADIEAFLDRDFNSQELCGASSFISPSLRHHSFSQSIRKKTDQQSIRYDKLEHLAFAIYSAFMTEDSRFLQNKSFNTGVLWTPLTISLFLSHCGHKKSPARRPNIRRRADSDLGL